MSCGSAAEDGPLLKKQKKEHETSIDAYLQNHGTDPKKKPKIRATTRDVLWAVETEMDGRTCHSYFITDGSIKFRHEGSNQSVPEKFFLENRSGPDYDDYVLVEFAASGSGKTVDLAGSSVSRGAHLTILMSIHDPTVIEKYQFKPVDESSHETAVEHEERVEFDEGGRNRVAFEHIKKEVNKKFKDNEHLNKICEFAALNEGLRVVVAIDETSTCPLIARSIISDEPQAEIAIREALGSVVETVYFSLGGTGASVACAGSNTENYTPVDPSARSPLLHKRLCDHLLSKTETRRCFFPGKTEPEAVTASSIKVNLPILWELMENGRMASIAAQTLLSVTNGDGPQKLIEAQLVSAVVDGYISSNGLRPLNLRNNPEAKQIVAACALAVNLFQWTEDYEGKKTPRHPELFASFMNTMECGVYFTKHAATKIHGENPIKKIVSIYGLIEPNLELDFRPGEIAKDLFVMKPAQQLVALSMLGMDATMFLEASPFGFEVLSTHIVKCVIAASSLIVEEKRPTVQKALKMVGFQIDENSTTEAMTGVWKRLDTFKVHEHIFDFQGAAKDIGVMKTRPMKVELQHLCDNETGEDILQIDSEAYKALKAIAVGRVVSGEVFALPSAWINYGSSPLADGFVTFYVTETGAIRGSTFKFTVMIQAKDYHNGSKLNTTKLNEHAHRCGASVLDGIFGEDRLLCVAGSQEVVLAKKARAADKRRAVLPYVFDNGLILKSLLGTLQSQRNVTTRVRVHATFCNAAGNDLTDQYKPEDVSGQK